MIGKQRKWTVKKKGEKNLRTENGECMKQRGIVNIAE